MNKSAEYRALFPDLKPDGAPKKKKSKGQDWEGRLWNEFEFYNVPLPVRQFMFHDTRQWRFDFAWPDRKIAVELHGGIYGGSNFHHKNGAQLEGDYEKMNEAQRLGWRVFQFGPGAIKVPKRVTGSSKALEYLFKILKPGANL